jgi:hypothetical protein
MDREALLQVSILLLLLVGATAHGDGQDLEPRKTLITKIATKLMSSLM